MADDRFPHIQITGGPDPGSLKIYRDGKELHTVLEFQVYGNTEGPVTVTFKEMVTFDGSVEVFGERKTGGNAH